MFNWLRPYGAADILHPVLQQEWPRLRWLRTPDAVTRYNRIVLIGLPTIVDLWWFLERLNLNFGSVPPGFEAILTNLLLVVSLGLMIISSFSTVIATIGPLNLQLTTGQWDDLRITSLRETDIVMAKDAVAQLRVWPIVAVEVGVRLAILGIMVLSGLYISYQMSVDNTYFPVTTVSNPRYWTDYVVVIGTGLTYAFEPLLRMRVLVALCIALALKVRTLVSALLGGFGAIVVMYIVQGIWFGSLWYFSEPYFFEYYVRDGEARMREYFVRDYFLPAAFVAAVVFYLIYVAIRKAALSFAVRKAFATG